MKFGKIKKLKKRFFKDRLNPIFAFMIFIMIILSANVFCVSVLKVHLLSGRNLKDYAESANVQTIELKATRGYIYDRNKNIIAQDIRTYDIVCILSSERPSVEGTIAYVADKQNTAEKLSTPLDMSVEDILGYLNSNSYQTELGPKGRNLSKETKDLIESYDLPGIEFSESITRSYPLGIFASNIIGFAQADESKITVGKMGIELRLDQYLRGKSGTKSYQADKNGFILPGMKVEQNAAVNGNNVTLTLDKTVQEALEDAFIQTESDFTVTRVWGAVSEIKTGRILAWGQSPSFDPNVLDIEEYNDYGSELAYEAGSTIKTFAWAAAMDSGKYDGTALVSANDFYYIADSNNNPVRVNYNTGNRITNSRYKQYGNVEYDYGLILSANTVAASLITDVITPEEYEQYLDAFGFFKETGAYGFNEASGVKVYTWSTDKITNTYGQGSTYTVLQLLQAYSAVFSDGTMKKPYIIESITDSYDDQNVIYQGKTEITGTPISPDTAKKMQALLERVVTDPLGTAQYYDIPETQVIGKTGTTQVSVNGSYASGTTISSVMLAFPADDPQYMVYYAFQGPYNLNSHYNTEAVKTLLRRVAMYYNIIDDDQTVVGSEQEESEEIIDSGENIEIKDFTMPNCINHTLDYVANLFNDTGANIVILGDGDTVINQYPTSGSEVSNQNKVFLLTDTNSFTMPDMYGWTRKDVSCFWEVTGFGVTIDGLGTVVEQSIAPGEIVTKDSDIKITLSQE